MCFLVDRNTTSALMKADGQTGPYVMKERFVYDPNGQMMALALAPDRTDYAHVANVAYDNDPTRAENKSVVGFRWRCQWRVCR